MDSLLVTVRAALQNFEGTLWTATPAIVESFSAAAVTCSAQPAIQVQVRSPAGAWTSTTLPLCVDCPVVFPGGGGFAATFPLAKGDEGLLVFAQRCIDLWWQSGGIQPQAELRMHDLSDGFLIPGVFSQPRVPVGGVSATGAEIRSLDNTAVMHLDKAKFSASLNSGRTVLVADDGAQKVEVTAANGLWVNGVLVTVP